MRERPKFDSRTLKRLLSYMRAYKGTLVLVTVCILLSAVAGAASSMFLQKLIDGYIVPMLGTASPDYSGLVRELITIGCVYLVGTLATWLYNRRMVTIAQGALKRIRDEMFEKMQSLPIRYFDTHTHGDIMSLYTNDTDTLRQMIAQSMAQLVSSVFTLAAVFFCMLYISIWLTLIVCAVMALILVFVRKLTGRIGGYFMAQFKIMFVVALVLMGGLMLLGVHYWAVLAVAIAILDFLPMFGTGTVLIPWAAVKLFTGDFAYAAGLGLLYVLSQAVRQIIQPKIQEIQAKYKNNQAKMNEELQALYAKENYNPMSGCGTLLIQFPVIFGLLDVVYKPLTHLLRFSKETIAALTEVAGTLGIATTGYAPQISIYQSVMQNPTAYSSVGTDVIAKIQSLDMGFLGMDLSGTPNLPWQGGWNWLVIIPLLSGLTALLSSIISMKNSPNMGQAGASMKMMMYIMPLISIWFTFMVPIGVGIYWTLSNVFGCVQSLVLNKIYNPKEVAEKLQAEAKERAERERQERIEAKKRAKEALKNGEKVEDTTYLSDKEKIKEARRRYAEKYGDEYIDD